jgi:hypothetical protein
MNANTLVYHGLKFLTLGIVIMVLMLFVVAGIIDYTYWITCKNVGGHVLSDGRRVICIDQSNKDLNIYPYPLN